MNDIHQPHLEVNEDGREYNHPGYDEIPCPVCRRPILCSKRCLAPQCGRKDCGKEDKHA